MNVDPDQPLILLTAPIGLAAFNNWWYNTSFNIYA